MGLFLPFRCYSRSVSEQIQTIQLPLQRSSVYKNGTRFSPNTATEIFAFPADDSAELDSRKNEKNRTPIYIPNYCRENEILYPGNQASDWVCDCKPTFVYYPPTNRCYQLFTQGYCRNGFMLTLAQNSKLPRCVVNPCAASNQVLFRSQCVTLNQPHSVCNYYQLSQIVTVLPNNTLGCVNQSGNRQLYPSSYNVPIKPPLTLVKSEEEQSITTEPTSTPLSESSSSSDGGDETQAESSGDGSFSTDSPTDEDTTSNRSSETGTITPVEASGDDTLGESSGDRETNESSGDRATNEPSGIDVLQPTTESTGENDGIESTSDDTSPSWEPLVEIESISTTESGDE